MNRSTAALAVAALLALPPATTAADPVADTARSLATQYGDALVTVKLVLKRRMVVQGQERGSSEAPGEVLGTVITASGLTVVSDSDSDPWGMFSHEGDGPKVETETTDVKIVLKDGREVGARFVLRDRDLDLAFVMPDDTNLKLPFVSLDAARIPELAEEILFLRRAGKSLNREVSVNLGRVQAVTRKPRTFVVVDWMNGVQGLGGPVFDTKGTLVGLSVLRRAPGSPANDSRMRGPFDMITPVVLTAPDIKGLVAEAEKRATPQS